MNPSSKRILTIAYVCALALPFLCIAAFTTRDIGRWLAAGMCPAGPMDRPARLCGPLDFFFIVFLGGWASFVVVPILAVWWGGCTAGLLALRAVLRRRAKAG